MGKKTLVTVVAAAALVVALAIIAASSLRPRATGQGPAPGGDPAAEREATAERLFAQAQLAMDRADWTAVIAILDRLWVECGSTRFLEANRATVSRMLAQAKSKLAVAVRPPIPPPKKPPPAPDPEPNLAEALREWPVAFEDKLASRECLKRGWLFKGQYGGHFEVKGALRVSGMHTISAVWWRQPVGDDFLLSVDVCPEDNATPLIWLCGPGYGTSPGTGYLLRVSVLEKQFRFDRHGQAWGPPHVPGPRWGEWYHIDVLRHRRVLALHINGQQVGRWHDPAPLRGPANAFIGFGSHLGFSGKRGAWFRQMTIRMPEEEAQRLKKAPVERILDPPLTVLPRPNGERLAHDGFGQGVISRWSAARREWGIHETKEGLVLRGPNAWPRPWRVEAFTAPFALDLPMSYFPNGEAVNFSVRLRHGDALDKGRERYRGWTLSFPAGDGLVALDWHDEEGKAHRSAQNAYFAPVPGRQYVLRLELARERLRVFSNGALILAGRSPRPIADGEPVYLGFRQIYGGSRVRHVTVHRIDP
ncbi:MAG: hypothetical protein ISS72_10085, partial [Candidatus Brocadiae bacterium]|nr:hypothetical protein [Candidatus Brocadiia bacterium]